MIDSKDAIATMSSNVPGKIFEQIPKIMAEIEAIAKTRKNAQQGFMFRGIDDIYQELHNRLAKHGVFTAPTVLDFTRSEKPTKNGGLMTYTVAKIKYRFFAYDGSCFECVVIGEGSDSGDKSSNKSMAIAHKYALLQVFCIPTDDEKDPDAQSHEVEHLPAPAYAKFVEWARREQLEPTDVRAKVKAMFGKEAAADLTSEELSKLVLALRGDFNESFDESGTPLPGNK